MPHIIKHHLQILKYDYDIGRGDCILRCTNRIDPAAMFHVSIESVIKSPEQPAEESARAYLSDIFYTIRDMGIRCNLAIDSIEFHSGDIEGVKQACIKYVSLYA